MIKKLYKNFEEITGSFLLVVICVIAVIQVTSRYLFEQPFSWTEELGTYVFVYLTFIGAALALKKKEHFALEIITDHIHEKVRAPVRVLVAALVCVCSVIILWFGWQLTANGWNVRTPALEVSSSFAYAAVPLGGFLMLLRACEILVAETRSLFRTIASSTTNSVME